MDFLAQVESTVDNVLSDPLNNDTRPPTDDNNDMEPHQPPPHYNCEAVKIATSLRKRLERAKRLGVCRRCWLQATHCYCAQCPPLSINVKESMPISGLNRIFVVLHHREVLMGVDTAKLILSTFSADTVRLVIAGIPASHQPSLAELEHVIADKRLLLVLFPDDTAQTFAELVAAQEAKRDMGRRRNGKNTPEVEEKDCVANMENQEGASWDLVILDGTWQQARRIKKRYFPNNDGGQRDFSVQFVKLGPAALALLEEQQECDEPETPVTNKNHYNLRARCPREGHQLRKHSTEWKKIATFEALRLFLADVWFVQQQRLQGSSSPEQCLDDEDTTTFAPPLFILQVKEYLRIANEAALSRTTW